MFKYFSRLSISEPDTITLDDITYLIDVSAKMQNRKNADLLEFLQRLKVEMEDLLASCYFKILSKGGNHFVFPFLLDEDFKGISSSEPYKINEEQSRLLHKARAKHNSSLKRICEKLDISKLSGHVPRHTIASIMLNEGSSVEQISLILGHSNFKTTQEYLKKFPEKLHKEALDKFRGVLRN
jgi:integrase